MDAAREYLAASIVGCATAIHAVFTWIIAVGTCACFKRTPAPAVRSVRTARSTQAADHDENDEDDDMLLVESETLGLLSEPSISFKEQMTMSPLEKLRKYHRIPFKLLFNLAVTALVTAFMISDNLQYASFVNASSTAFRKVLGNDQPDTLEGL